jgi:hypothetical protein
MRVHTSVHPATEEMDLGSGRFCFVPASDKAVALVDALCGVNRKYLSYLLASSKRMSWCRATHACPADKAAESACYNHSQRVCRRSATRVRQDLLYTLICDKVDTGADRISNYVMSAKLYIPCRPAHSRRCRWNPE